MTSAARPLDDSPWRLFAWRGLKVLAIGIGIALLFALAQPHKLGVSMAYAVPITFGCWFFIDAGRLLCARWAQRRNPHAHPQWPGWPWMAGVLVVGTVLGYQTGHSIGNLVTGQNAPGLLFEGPVRAASLVAFSLVPGVAMSGVGGGHMRAAPLPYGGAEVLQAGAHEKSPVSPRRPIRRARVW